MEELSKHPEMKNIISSIRKIAENFPCQDCKQLKDDLNATKSRLNHWKDKYDKLEEAIQIFADECRGDNELFRKLNDLIEST